MRRLRAAAVRAAAVVRSPRALGAALRARRPGLVRYAVLWVVSYAVLLGFFFNLVLNRRNYLEIFPGELVIPMLMHALTAAAVAAIMFWCKPLAGLAAKLVAALVLSLLLAGYDGNLLAVAGLVRAMVPGMTNTDTLPAVSLFYFLLLAGLSVLAGLAYLRLRRAFPRIQDSNTQAAIVILAACFCLVPGFSVARFLPDMARESRVQAPEFTAPAAAGRAAAPAGSAKDKPDIFYIVLDRYTNQTVLKDQFDFDNSNFTGYLRDNGFAVNQDAYSNYPYTAISVSSTMAAGYTKPQVEPFVNSSVQANTLYHNIIWQSPVVKAIKQQGYNYYSLGAPYGASYKAPLANQDQARQHLLQVFGAEKRLRGIEYTAFSQSVFYRFSQVSASWWPLKSKDLSGADGTIHQLNLLDWLTTKDKPGGRLIFAHFLVPHDPFYFNADGSLATDIATNNVGKPIKQKYTGQVEFINNEMRRIIGQIQKQSNGQAVIVLNADEGPYPQILNDTIKQNSWVAGGVKGDGFTDGDMRDWPDDWLRMKFGILQAARIPRATADDREHLTSANAFRIILNRYFGYDMDYLPECHFGLTNGGANQYRYADITARLSPEGGDPRICRDFATVR